MQTSPAFIASSQVYMITGPHFSYLPFLDSQSGGKRGGGRVEQRDRERGGGDGGGYNREKERTESEQTRDIDR